MLTVEAESAAHQGRAVARSETDAFLGGSANLVESICAAVSTESGTAEQCVFTSTRLNIPVYIG